MTVLEGINKMWKSLIEKEKVRLIVKQNPESLGFLQELRILNVYRVEREYAYNDWNIHVCYKQEELVFTNHDGYFSQSFENGLNDSNEETDLFYKLLRKMEIENYIELLALEKDMVKLKHAETNHVGFKIVSVQEMKGKLIYILENGETIEKSVKE